MQTENIKPTEGSAVAVATRNFLLEDANVVGAYTVTCTAADGTIRWEETFKNLVVLSLIHISEPTRRTPSRMPSSA